MCLGNTIYSLLLRIFLPNDIPELQKLSPLLMFVAGEEREHSPDECFAQSGGLRAHAHYVQLPARVHCWSAPHSLTISYRTTRTCSFGFFLTYSIIRICPGKLTIYSSNMYSYRWIWLRRGPRRRRHCSSRLHPSRQEEWWRLRSICEHFLQFISRIQYSCPYTDTLKEC